MGFIFKAGEEGNQIYKAKLVARGFQKNNKNILDGIRAPVAILSTLMIFVIIIIYLC